MQRPEWLPRETGISTAAIPLLSGAYAVAVASAILRPAPAITSYAQVSESLALLNMVTGALLLAAGSLGWVLGRRRLGLLAIAAGACWFGADLAGHATLAPGVRYAGAFASLMVFPLLVHLVAHMHRADGTRRARRVILLLYLVTGVLSVASLSAYVPWLDPWCVALCSLTEVGPFPDYRVARILAVSVQVATILAGIGLAGWAAARYARSTPVARRNTGRTLVPAAFVGIAWAASAAAAIQPSRVVPRLGDVMVALFLGRALATSLLGAGLAWWLLDGRRTLRAVRRIASDLSPLPGGGSLRSALAIALGDPDLELVFPLPDGSGFVNAAGAPAGDPSAQPRSHNTVIEAGGVTVAVAIARGDTPPIALADALGDAVRLAAANERLLAAVRHEVLELQASRARIVETGDAARHAIERDLHDGAQHRMLGVLHELSLAHGAALERGDAATAERLEVAIDEADEAIESLRRLARGIHPATLTEAGLLPALEALADEAAIPLEVEAPADVRFPRDVEATAWRVVAQAVGAATRLGADGVSARVIAAPQHLELDLVIDGASSVPDTTALEDRVGAAGGSMTVQRVTAGVTSLHVELPCA